MQDHLYLYIHVPLQIAYFLSPVASRVHSAYSGCIRPGQATFYLDGMRSASTGCIRSCPDSRIGMVGLRRRGLVLRDTCVGRSWPARVRSISESQNENAAQGTASRRRGDQSGVDRAPWIAQRRSSAAAAPAPAACSGAPTSSQPVAAMVA